MQQEHAACRTAMLTTCSEALLHDNHHRKVLTANVCAGHALCTPLHNMWITQGSMISEASLHTDATHLNWAGV